MIPRRGWNLTKDERVDEAIEELEDVFQHKIEKDIQKLESRGLGAKWPLIGHYEGDIYYLRSINQHGIFRIFYFRDGKRSFRGFYAFQKKNDKIPRRHKKNIERIFRKITGERP